MDVDNRGAMKRIGIVLILFFQFTYGSAQEKVISREYEKEYITYPFSDPNPIPSQEKLYPYFRFDGFTSEGKAKKWKVVDLENDFIKVQIMPEIGGKVWTAYDKVHKKYFLYNNEVVKFRDIAMRGPWVSGGIEANYGTIGHTPNSATPVDYVLVQNEDESQSCFISTLDLLTRTRWVLEIKLEADKAYFTTRSFWFNATGIEQPYYTWMNAGIPAGEDLQFLYPGTHFIGHDGQAHDWPIDQEGRNLSYYNENNFEGSKSYHVLGASSKYFGALWSKEDFGMIHYSDREAKLGKKIFLWAQSAQGQLWEELLTDHSGQYVEIQSGRLFNQNVFSSSSTPFKQIGFAPYSSESWTEYWFPFGDLNGFSEANLLGAYSIQLRDDELLFAISPVKYLNDSLRLYNNEGQSIASTFMSAEPLKAARFSVNIPKGETVSYMTLDGHRMPMNKDESLKRPLQRLQDYEENSAYGLYMQGRDHYRLRQYALANDKVKASLSIDDAFLPALVEMAKIKYHQLNFDSALWFSKRALSIDTYDPEANYYYGLSSKKLSQFYDAKDGFEVASLSPHYRNAANTELSKLYLSEGDWTMALQKAQVAMKDNATNIEALRILYLLARIDGNASLMKQSAHLILASNPLDHFVRFEKYLQDPSEENKEAFLSLIRNELPEETILELAIWYANGNRLEESRQLLSIAPRTIMGTYWLAWLNKGTPAATQYLKEADKASLAFVFPFREESAQVLHWVRSTQDSWKAKYLLALINDFRGNRAMAATLLNDEVDYAPYYIVKARVQEEAPLEEKINSVRDAISLQPSEWRYQRILASLLAQGGEDKKAADVLLETYNADTTNYMVGLDLVKLLMRSSQYELAERVLSGLTVLPFEGATDARVYYRQTKLMLAFRALENNELQQAQDKVEEARQWPRNLGVGKPYPELIDDRLERVLSIMIFSELGESVDSISLEGIEPEDLSDRSALEKEIEALSSEEDQRMF